MLEAIRPWFKINIASIVLVVCYVSEAYSKVLNFSYSSTTLIPRTFKLALLIVFAIGIIRRKYKLLLWPLVLLLFVVLGQYKLTNSYNLDIIIVYGKLLFPIIFFMFMTLYSFSVGQIKSFLRTFEGLMTLNCILIILGIIFDIFFLKTYNGSRFGYSGFMVTSATASYVHIVYLIYLFAKYRENFFNVPKNIFVLLCCFLIGTKALYIFILGFFLVWVFSRFQGRTRTSLLLVITILAGGIGYVFFYKYGIFYEIQKSKGLFTAIMSYRDQLFLNNTLPFIESNWTLINYMFGGVSDVSTKSQIDFVDVFYYFGIFGGVVYLVTYFKSFISFKPDRSVLVLFYILVFIVFLAGNFFSYPSIVIYLVALREFLIIRNKKSFIRD